MDTRPDDETPWRDDNVCIACGGNNPIGLRLKFQWEGDLLTSVYTPRPEHQGWAGYVHGGMIALVLDEVMAHAVNRSGYLSPTAEMSVRFRRPHPYGEPLRLTATRPQGRRLLTLHAEARDADGRLVAEATGKFLPFSRPQETGG